jgi:hypothetical protein
MLEDAQIDRVRTESMNWTIKCVTMLWALPIPRTSLPLDQFKVNLIRFATVNHKKMSFQVSQSQLSSLSLSLSL